MNVITDSPFAERSYSDYSLEQLLELSYSAEQKSKLFVHSRLSEVFNSSPIIPFNYNTPLIFFSDCHRGIGDITEPFTQNEQLYYYALKYYYSKGYSYVEVGDGDEMYLHSFSRIQSRYGQIFELLHDYNRQDRLVMIAGNHDLEPSFSKKIGKNGITTHEGVVLENTRNGSKIFAVHGHQADILSDRLRPLGRALVKCIIDPLLKKGMLSFSESGDKGHLFKRPLPKWVSSYIKHSQNKIEKRITSWISKNQQMLICGHTHRFVSSPLSNVPYFNTGSCLAPGLLTGIEVVNGNINQIRWVVKKPSKGGAYTIKRELAAQPLDLIQYAI
jgi:UDP-2,3-diacylglucosamine pyrophosphatase LpxH